MGNTLTRIHSYSELELHVQQASIIASKFRDREGQCVLFRLMPRSEKDIPIPLLWRHFVHVWAHKGNRRRKMNFKEFCRFYEAIVQNVPAEYLVSLTSDGSSNDLSLREDEHIEEEEDEKDDLVNTELHSLKDSGDSETSECMICMDATANICLPCAHSFCEDCIKSWYTKHSSCPMCRSQLSSSAVMSDSFLLILDDVTPKDDFHRYLTQLFENIIPDS